MRSFFLLLIKNLFKLFHLPSEINWQNFTREKFSSTTCRGFNKYLHHFGRLNFGNSKQKGWYHFKDYFGKNIQQNGICANHIQHRKFCGTHLPVGDRYPYGTTIRTLQCLSICEYQAKRRFFHLCQMGADPASGF